MTFFLFSFVLSCFLSWFRATQPEQK